MLKLKNSNGTFDIVFESAPLLDDDAKRSGHKATSAKRRKNREWKSSVLPRKNPKEPDYTKVKASKAMQLRDEVVAKKYDTEKNKKPIKEPANVKKSKKTSNKENLKGKSSTNETDKDRRDTSSTYSIDDAGVITEKELNKINENLRVKNTAVTPEHSPNTTLDTSREEELRRLQATPIQIYDPWGKPGAGAPMNSMDGSIRTHRNVRLLQQEKETKASVKKMTNETPPPCVSLDSPRNSKPQNTATQSEQTGTVNRFARGQGKAEHELADMEKARLKQLEHQRAIAAQVEEKRLQKQLEKERKQREEEEAEERYQKQQELIQQRLDEEQQKEREKQEAKILKQKMIEESIKKAEEEALKAKEEARKARWANAETSKSPTNFPSGSPRYKRILHNENDAIRPSQNFDESEFASPKRNSLTENIVLSSQDETQTSQREKPTKFPSRIPQPMGRNRPANKVKEEQSTYRVDEDKPTNNVSVYSKLMEESHLDDYLVPFHRTKTANMYEDQSNESDDQEEGDGKQKEEEKEEEEEESDMVEELQQSVNKKKEQERLRKYSKNDRNEISKTEKKKKKAAETKPHSKDEVVTESKQKRKAEKLINRNGSDERQVQEATNVTKKKEKRNRKPKDHTPRARTLSVENEHTSTGDLLNTRKSVKKPSTTPQVNKRRNSPPLHNQDSGDAPLTPSTRRQQEILNRLAELRQGLQQKERECYNTTW